MRRMLMVALTLFTTLVSAQASFWDAPTRGTGSSQAEALKVLQGAKSEVFLLLPALYTDLGQTLAQLGGRGVQVRVVIGKNGVGVSNGIALLGNRAQVRMADRPPLSGIGVVDRGLFLTGGAVWNPREKGYRWYALPGGSGNSLLDQLKYVWQAAKPLAGGTK